MGIARSAQMVCLTVGLAFAAARPLFAAGAAPSGGRSGGVASKPTAQSSRGLPAPQAAQSRRRPAPAERLVFKDQIIPYWFANSGRFWYRNDLAGGAREFVLVDAEKGVRQPAFDHARLAAALSKAMNERYTTTRLPFDTIRISDDERLLRFSVEGRDWQLDLASYTLEPSPEPYLIPGRQGPILAGRPNVPPRGGPGRPLAAPDGSWTAEVRDGNIVLRAATGTETALTKDGAENSPYDILESSPDSKYLVAWKVTPGDRRPVYLIQSSPPGGGRAQLLTRPYALPGDRFTTYALSLFDIDKRTQLRPEVDLYEHEWERPEIHWRADGTHFTYEKEDRGHQRLRLIDVNVATGAVRNLVDETTSTFIWTAHTEMLGVPLFTWLSKTDEILYVSERDGWRHLYLVDAKAGASEKQITHGEWVVRGIERIDEAKRQIWFRASGMNPGQDPYFVHFYRINFDGTGLTALTDGNGTHQVAFSPDRRFLIDTYSRVDMAPVNELRRVSDGKKLCLLERADITALTAKGWRPPEVFKAKGRDGKTDIWGIICRPPRIDPARKVPVLESIYAGPQGAYVPKAFSPVERFAQFTHLGFIVAQIDGMGTAFRSKAFHDVCWRNLKDAGFPDRILWHRAVAAKYPYYDLRRVGIYGTSAGGQNAAAAVLFHPDFYKAAVANSGCHDNRMDKASWNEQWIGYPVGPQYSESSNIDNAARLGGKLLLIVGELDTNVPPESTLRFADALIAANKDFEMLVVPGADHGISGPHYEYAQRKTREFFVRNLLGGGAGR